jgi:hypothetical protein
VAGSFAIRQSKTIRAQSAAPISAFSFALEDMARKWMTSESQVECGNGWKIN